jgi:hypothetical protein
VTKKNDDAARRLAEQREHFCASLNKLVGLAKHLSEINYIGGEPVFALSPVLRGLFETVGLDPGKPNHHVALLEFLVRLLVDIMRYTEPGKRGHRPKDWPIERLRTLLEHYEQERERDPHRSPKETRSALRMKHRYPAIKNDDVHRDRLAEAKRVRKAEKEELGKLLAEAMQASKLWLLTEDELRFRSGDWAPPLFHPRSHRKS